MSTYLQAGNYRHDSGEIGVTIWKETTRVNGIPRTLIHRWNISGRLQKDTTALVIAQINSLVAAYVDGIDLVLYMDDGTEAHALRSAGSLGGTRILKPPDFPIGQGAELSTFRNYSILVEAEYPALGTVLLAFQETFSFAFQRKQKG